MANLRDQLSDVFHLLNDIIHGAPCGVYLLGAGLYLTGAGINQLTDIVGGISAAAGKMANFPCHHRKAFALLTGPCRFYRRIQGEDIGLEGNIVDQGGNGADTLGTVGDIVHGFDHRLHRVPAFGRRTAGGYGELIHFGGGFRVTLNGGRHLVHRRHGLLHVCNGLTRAVVQILITLRQLVAAVAHAHHLA